MELALLFILIEIGGLLGGKTDVVFLWEGIFRGEIPWIEFYRVSLCRSTDILGEITDMLVIGARDLCRLSFLI